MSEEAKKRTIARMAREVWAKVERGELVHVPTPARVDADRKAKPKTRLVGHARQGDCVGPGTVEADSIEDTATGERTPLKGD